MNAQKTRPQADSIANLESAIAEVFDGAKQMTVASIHHASLIDLPVDAAVRTPFEIATSIACASARTTKDLLDLSIRCQESGWRLWNETIRNLKPQSADRA